MKRRYLILLALVAAAAAARLGWWDPEELLSHWQTADPPAQVQVQPADIPFDLADVPAFAGAPYVEINGNRPYFTAEDMTTAAFEFYTPLDALGRCGPAYACVGTELMPTEPREAIGMIRPSGWHTVRYDDLIEGKYLYNRCHLLGYQLTGENANEQNLITGTRFLNVHGMVSFENQVAKYIRNTGHHVLYRVTPVFEGENLLATGVLMEALSVEDEGIQFCVFVYNAQPGIYIDYATGDSARAEDVITETDSPQGESVILSPWIGPGAAWQ